MLDCRGSEASPFAIAREQAVGRPIARLLPAAVHEPATTAITSALATGELQTFEYALALPGGPRHFEARVVRCAPAEVFATVRDITERQLQQAALQRRLEFERLITDLSSEFVGPAHVPTRTLINSALRRVAQFLGGDLIVLSRVTDGKPQCVGGWICDPDLAQCDDDRFLSEAFPWLCSEASVTRELRVDAAQPLPEGASQDRMTWRKLGLGEAVIGAMPAGEAGVGRLFVASLASSSGGLLGLEQPGMVTLAGQMLLSAAARARADDALQASNEQLRHAQRMDAIGRLSGGIAHDFNNLMTIVAGCAEIALEESGECTACGGAIAEDLRDILEAAKRAATLTSQLLAFSRKQASDATTQPLAEVITPSVRILERVLGDEVSLEVDVADGDAVVEVDSSQLGQVLLNLAVNARDAMPNGGVIRLSTRTHDLERPMAMTTGVVPPGRYATMTLVDQGQGIDETAAAHIFEPFYTTKEVGRGTGLGLSICYGIVRQANGFIWLDRVATGGTAAHVWLPIADALSPDSATVAQADSATGGDEHILLVENDPAVRAVTTRVLLRLGYRLTVVDGGEEALALLESLSAPPDLLLTDVRMPRVNGHEVAHRFRAVFPDLPVLLMSGFMEDRPAAPDLRTTTKQLTKPFGRAELAAAVREALPDTNMGRPS